MTHHARSFLLFAVLAVEPVALDGAESPISGRYPHLAVFNEHRECGIGAVVPWAGRLWIITYPPHKPRGSTDKLYEITDELELVTRPESVGGTHANRLIHRESDQLIIGPYFIDRSGTVRVVAPEKMPGRLTATLRHLEDPANKVYFLGMEKELYEVDVHTLEVSRLWAEIPVPGTHGKGGYTAQGRVVVSQNGDASWYPAWRKDPDYRGPTGSLAEWDGEEWTLVERTPFNEVTGPGGVHGASTHEEPVWATGWDRRSVILAVRGGGAWHRFRIPKGCYSYDAGHGWYTEWPRIREVGPGRILLNMHGGWYRLPKGFSASRPEGLSPVGRHLKITADFCGFQDRLVFACDDVAILDNPFVNQSQSNLWFTTWEGLHDCGRPGGWGGPWVRDAVTEDQPSDPFFIGGFEKGVIHVSHDTGEEVTVALEGLEGGRWMRWKDIVVPARGYAFEILPVQERPEWMRARSDRDAVGVSVYVHAGPGGGVREDQDLFRALAALEPSGRTAGGVVRPRGGGLGTLQLLSTVTGASGVAGGSRYYEVDADLRLRHRPSKEEERKFLEDTCRVRGPGVEHDAASVIATDHRGRRYRLPKGGAAYDAPWTTGWPRGVREVVTERSLLNAHGTFYVLPRPSAGGIAQLKPVATHERRITDFCVWRGLLVLMGLSLETEEDPHVLRSDDGKAAIWVGDVDDLWKLGKPRGVGGPWKSTPVRASTPSDPYLMAGYDRKSVELSHDAPHAVRVTIEVDFLGRGKWREYRTFEVPSGETVHHAFPDGYSAHWVRVRAREDCTATALFIYQ